MGKIASSFKCSHRLVREGFHWLALPITAITNLLWPTLASGLQKLQFDPGDTLLNLYFLEHNTRYLFGGGLLHRASYWSPDFFWPSTNVIAWSDHLILPSLLYAPFRLVFDPYISYVAWLVLTLLLSYCSLRWALQRIAPTCGALALSLISLICVFSPAITIQLMHPQLLSLYLMGPVIVAVNELLTTPKDSYSSRQGLLLLLALMANGFLNIYLFVYASYGALMAILIRICCSFDVNGFSTFLNSDSEERALTLRRAFRLRREPGDRNLLAGTLSVSGLLISLYLPYLQTLKTFGSRPADEIRANTPELSSWLHQGPTLLLPAPILPGSSLGQQITGVESEAFVGYGLLALWLFGLALTLWVRMRGNEVSWRRITPENRQRWQQAFSWFLLTLLLAAGVLRVADFSAWPLIAKLLPGASSLRAMSRVTIMLVLFGGAPIACALAAWTPNRLLRSPHQLLQIAFGGLFVAGSLASIWRTNQPRFDLLAWKRELHQLTSGLRDQRCDLFFYKRNNSPDWARHVLAMHAQQQTGVATINGYSGWFPKGGWPYEAQYSDQAFGWAAMHRGQPHFKTKLRRGQVTPLHSCEFSWSSGRMDPPRILPSSIVYPQTILRDNGTQR